MTYEQSRAIARAAIAAGEAAGQTWKITVADVYLEGEESPDYAVTRPTLREAVAKLHEDLAGLTDINPWIDGPAGVGFEVELAEGAIEWSAGVDAITAEIADMAEACCASLFGEATP